MQQSLDKLKRSNERLVEQIKHLVRWTRYTPVERAAKAAEDRQEAAASDTSAAADVQLTNSNLGGNVSYGADDSEISSEGSVIVFGDSPA